MERILTNDWQPQPEGFESARILRHQDTPEGFDVTRLRSAQTAELALDPAAGHILTVLQGSAQLFDAQQVLALSQGAHVYLPVGGPRRLRLAPHTQLVQVSTAQPEQAVGQAIQVRHEHFLSACASDGQSLRWILTPQYLSRRVFLHHDAPLRSREGRPVSWFRTTMFDVSGLAPNEEGESVFRMSYDSRSEFNVCYEVRGQARVRLARHPYVAKGQQWSPWLPLHDDATYHLDEAAGGPQEEHYIDASGRQATLRNRHEVSITGGHTSLCCLFDPAPTGVERHRPGEYSDYEPFEQVRTRPEYARHVQALDAFDAMVDTLSMAQAQGRLEAMAHSPEWAMFEAGYREQRAIEARLQDELTAEGQGRDAVLAQWMLATDL